MRLTLVQPAVLAALGAAVLFGASTPLAKQLAGTVPAQWLAGLLYLGSGLGLAAGRIIRDRGWRTPPLQPRERWRLLGAIAFGGMLGPVLLMWGLARTPVATASLLLNLEAVFTATLAWLVFHENTDRRIVLGMGLIVLGGVWLSWLPDAAAGQQPWSWLGPLAVAGACLCWAIDNNLTRDVSGVDALFVAGTKGLVAGVANTGLFLLFAAVPVAWHLAPRAMLIGLVGYGLSLVLFVVALRGLGAARTGAYFSAAPFVGAGIGIVALGEVPSGSFWGATALMGAGVWLHLTERHDHEHTHDPIEHDHVHRHDEHHQHTHAPAWDGHEPHAHQHRHEPLSHRHPHFPDIHHGHRH